MHPYALVLYGIILWQIEQSFTKGFNFKERRNNIGRSLVWGSLIVIFDDEIIELINDKVDVIIYTSPYFYIIAGFTIDIIRTKIIKHEKELQNDKGEPRSF